MKQSEAVEMLSVSGKLLFSEEEVWADFGCGTGTFTLALAHLLAPNSRIIAIDKDPGSLKKISGQSDEVLIEKRHSDFVKDDYSFPLLDGILMANSLHYVRNLEAFIEKAKQYLKPEGCFLIVEYDTNSSNPWIPYPLSFTRLHTLFRAAGFSSIQKLTERPSRYNRSNLYSAIIEK